MSNASSDSEDERELIEHYFARGFQYNTIIDFLSKRHGISMSERALRSRLNVYGLRRKSPEYNLDEIRELTQEKLQDPAYMGGYCSMWHALLISGHQVPRTWLHCSVNSAPQSMPISYGTSPANQRIESWWSQLRRSRSTWWMNYFKDMIERGHLNTDNGPEMECLWICFSSLILKDRDLVKEQWNTHRIRASRHDTV